MFLTKTQRPLSLFRGAGLLPAVGICFALRKNSSEMTCPHVTSTLPAGPGHQPQTTCSADTRQNHCAVPMGHVPSGGRLVAAIHGSAAPHFPSVTGATPTVRRLSSVPGPGRWPGAGVPRMPGMSALAVSGKTDTASQTLLPREEWCRGNGLQQNFFCKYISSSKTKSRRAGPSRGFCVMVTKQMQSPAGHTADFISRHPPRFRPASGPSRQSPRQSKRLTSHVSEPTHIICPPLQEKLHQRARVPAQGQVGGVRALLCFSLIKVTTQRRHLLFLKCALTVLSNGTLSAGRRCS